MKSFSLQMSRRIGARSLIVAADCRYITNTEPGGVCRRPQAPRVVARPLSARDTAIPFEPCHLDQQLSRRLISRSPVLSDRDGPCSAVRASIAQAPLRQPVPPSSPPREAASCAGRSSTRWATAPASRARSSAPGGRSTEPGLGRREVGEGLGLHGIARHPASLQMTDPIAG